MGQVVNPPFVAVLNGQDPAGFQVIRRNSGDTGFEWATPAWVDRANTFSTDQTVTGKVFVGVLGTGGGLSNYVTIGPLSGTVGSGDQTPMFTARVGGRSLTFDEYGGLYGYTTLQDSALTFLFQGGGAYFAGSFLVRWTDGSSIYNSVDVTLGRSAAGTVGVRDAAGNPASLAAIFRPVTLTDAAAPNNSIYYSSTASKLVYKDAGGTVNNLY